MKTLLTVLTVGALAGKYLLACPQVLLSQQLGSTVASSCPMSLLARSFIFFLAGTGGGFSWRWRFQVAEEGSVPQTWLPKGTQLAFKWVDID